MKCFNDQELQQLIDNARKVSSASELYSAAVDLVAEAKRLGLVLTVEQFSVEPLAMGNHETLVSVRQARVAA